MAKMNPVEEALIRKGYVKDAKGNYTPPPQQGVLKQAKEAFLVQKQKVNTSEDFTHRLVTEWFIPYQIPSKKNSRQVFVGKNGKMMNIPSKAYSEYIAVTKNYWTVFGLEFQRTVTGLGLNYPLKIEMTFTRKTEQLVDYFGPGESVFDLMTDFKWWPDDNRRYGKPFFGDMIVDKNNPGSLIKILM